MEQQFKNSGVTQACQTSAALYGSDSEAKADNSSQIMVSYYQL